MAELSKLTKFKSEFEKECESAKFFFYEPIPPRKNITVHISAKSTSFAKAKQVLKEKFDEYQLVSQSFDEFQDNMKYHIVKYFFKFLHNSMIMNNTIFMKDWDLVSSEFEFLSKIPHIPSKRLLENIFQRDTTLQLYITFVCDMTQDTIYENFGMSAADMIDIIRKKCYQFLKNNSFFAEKRYNSVLRSKETSPHWGDAGDYVDKSDHHSVGSVDSRALAVSRSFSFGKHNDRGRDGDYHRRYNRGHDRYSDRDQSSDNRGYDKRRQDRFSGQSNNDRDPYWRDNRGGESRRKGSHYSNASRNDDRNDRNDRYDRNDKNERNDRYDRNDRNERTEQTKLPQDKLEETIKVKEEIPETVKESQAKPQENASRPFYFSDKPDKPDKPEPSSVDKTQNQHPLPPPKIELKEEATDSVTKQKESNEMEVEKALIPGPAGLDKESTATTQRVFRFISEKEEKEDPAQQVKREDDRESTGYRQIASDSKNYQNKFGSGGRDYQYQGQRTNYYQPPNKTDDRSSKGYVQKQSGYQSSNYNRRFESGSNREYSRNRSLSRDRNRSYRDRSSSRDRGRSSRSKGRDSRSRTRNSRSRERGRDSKSRGRYSKSRERRSYSRDRRSYSRERRSHSRGRRSPSRSREKNRRRTSRSPLRDSSRNYSKNPSTYHSGDRSPPSRPQDQSWSYSQKNYSTYDRTTSQTDDRDWKRDDNRSSYKKDYRDDTRSKDDRSRDWQDSNRDSKDQRYYRDSDRNYSQRDQRSSYNQDSTRSGTYRDFPSRDEGYHRDQYRDRDRRNSPNRYEKSHSLSKRDDAVGDYSKTYKQDSRDWNKGSYNGDRGYGTRRGSRSRSKSKSRSRSPSYRPPYSHRRSHSNQRSYNRDSRERDRNYRDDRYNSGSRNYRQPDDRWRSNTFDRSAGDRDDYKKSQPQYPSVDSSNLPVPSLKIEKPNTSYTENTSNWRYGNDSRTPQYEYNKDRHHTNYTNYRTGGVGGGHSNYNYRGGDRQRDEDRGLHIQKRARSNERKDNQDSSQQSLPGQSSQSLPGVIKQNDGKTESSAIDY